MTPPPYDRNEVRFLQSPHSSDCFMVYLHGESVVHLAVYPHDRVGWYIYGAVGGVQTFRQDRQEAVKFEVYSYALSHSNEVCERLLAEALTEAARIAAKL